MLNYHSKRVEAAFGPGSALGEAGYKDMYAERSVQRTSHAEAGRGRRTAA